MGLPKLTPPYAYKLFTQILDIIIINLLGLLTVAVFVFGLAWAFNA